MVNLKILAEKVSIFKKNKVRRTQEYPKDLRKMACKAAKIYGQGKVAKVTGIDQSVIYRWPESSSSAPSKNRPILKKNKRITFHEIKNKPLVASPQKISTEAPSIRLNSPTGFSMDLFGDHGSETIKFINAFLGGK